MADDFENEKLLGSLLEQGITTFVCLQREYDPRAPEAKWRSGVAIRPYYEDAVALAGAFYPGRRLQFLHFGIEDCSVVGTTSPTAVALARRIKTTNEVVYLHCWGGHGRAGTVVCLLLHFLYDQDAASAMMRCQFVHDLRRVPIVVGSPQTQTQRDQVSRVIARSIVSRKVAAAAAERAARDLAVEEQRRRRRASSQQKHTAGATPSGPARRASNAPHSGPTPAATPRAPRTPPEGVSLPRLMASVAVTQGAREEGRRGHGARARVAARGADDGARRLRGGGLRRRAAPATGRQAGQADARALRGEPPAGGRKIVSPPSSTRPRRRPRAPIVPQPPSRPPPSNPGGASS
ncbi:hypothetical protein JL722_8033 [Aureococcus anophagefferens]|nr:hypothetical protein JL722_8033 [Aureococcus anophagefferens]